MSEESDQRIRPRDTGYRGLPAHNPIGVWHQEVHVCNPATESLIASVKSGGNDGHFQLNLPPGQYQLRTEIVCGTGVSSYVLVAVRPLLFTDVTLDAYDIAGAAQGSPSG